MEETHELDIQHYLRVAWKRRFLFVITAALIITAAVVISYVLPPVYEAKTVVAVEKSFLDNIIKNLGGVQMI